MTSVTQLRLTETNYNTPVSYYAVVDGDSNLRTQVIYMNKRLQSDETRLNSITQLRVTITSIMEGHSSRDLLRLEVPNFDDGYSFSTTTKRSHSRLSMEYEDVSPLVSPSRNYQDRLILPLG